MAPSIVNVSGVEYPRHAVQFGHVAPLIRLAARNAVRRAEFADLSGDVPPRDVLKREMLDLHGVVKEQLAYMKDVLDNCYGPPGHDFNGNDLCNRCGADGRA